MQRFKRRVWHWLLVKFPVLERVPVDHIKRHWLTFSFFLGFIVDNLTLNRVDQIFDNLVLASYLVLAMASLLVLYAATAGRLPAWLDAYTDRIRRYAPMVTQYAFGGLLSGILIFYGRSATLYASWPFILIILAIIVGNEVLKRRAQRLIFNVTILFIGLFSYLVLIVPVILGTMGAWLFVLSGLLALFVIYWFIRALRGVVPNFVRANMRPVVFAIGACYVSLNMLYFTGSIPPIPLSLKDLGIYHDVARLASGQYALTYEDGAWYEFFKDSDDTFHYKQGNRVYCFASVFAPTRLSTDIYHRWEHYVEKDSEWRTHSRISYSIDGGRDGGFRGFTYIENVSEGEWRCTVETARKQVLGRVSFDVATTAPEHELVTEVR